jgi:hypothetical protein
MNSTWPKDVVDFQYFLSSAGFVCELQEEWATFGNKTLKYSDAGVGVRIVSDRGLWFVEVADVVDQPNEWYDAGVLRDLLVGPGEDILPLFEQIQVIKENLPTIMNRFGPIESEDTRIRLNLLRKERAKRRFPDVEAM